jgi:hypothetical protein
MSKKITLIAVIVITGIVFWVSCGTKINRPKENPGGGIIGETTYVQLDPPWDAVGGYSFNNPHKIIVGRDTYIYIADTDNNRIVRLDAHGTIQATYEVPHPIGLTQDELLRLLVVTGDSKDIYKINVGPGGDGIAVRCYSWRSDVYNDTLMLDDTDVFTDIACAAGYVKRYYVAAATPSIFNSGKIVVFKNQINVMDTIGWWKNDTLYQHPVPDPDSIVRDSVFDYLLNSKYLVGSDTCTNPQINYGTGLGSTSHPNGVTAFGRSGRNYLLYTQDSSYFKCQLLAYNNNTYYRLGWYASAFTGTDNDLHRNNYFIHPAAATVDSSGSIFVVGPRNTIDSTWWKGDSTYTYAVPDFDSVTTDSVIKYIHKFDANGVLKMSFAVFGDSTGQVKNPCGVAYDNFADRKTVYISDTGNNRIVRYKLSTDLGN